MVALVGLNRWYFTSSGWSTMFCASFNNVYHTKQDKTNVIPQICGAQVKKRLNLQRLERERAGVGAQDARVDHPAELLPLLMLSVERRRLRRGGGFVALCLHPAFNCRRHRVVVRSCSWCRG